MTIKLTADTKSRSGEAIRIVQISDCHLGENQAFLLAGVNTFDTFVSVLTHVVKEVSPPLIFVTGDIACEGLASSYRLFSEQMTLSKLNYRWLPGNHDDFQTMKKTIKQPFVRAEIIKHGIRDWVAMSIISAQAGCTNGALLESERQVLSDLLIQYKECHVLLFVHHPPVDVQCKWLDAQRIPDQDQLRELLACHDHVVGIFSGHVHQKSMGYLGHIPTYTVPSTCFQFASHSDSFKLSEYAPGYRWIDLHADGRITTGVERVVCDRRHIDFDCIGY